MEEKKCVLVVDDAPDNLILLRGVLEDKYRVRTAASGGEALSIARIPPRPDLILLDVLLPDLDGFRVCAELKREKQTAGIPVIFVTVMDGAADEARGFQLGAADYITKPVNPHLVRARVQAHLELKQIREELEKQNQILQENARLREEVEAITRHDLKNPLMVVLNATEMLQAAAGLTPPQRRLLGLAQEAGRRMLELINRTIDLYKMESGVYTLQPKTVEVFRVLQQVKASFQELLGSKGLTCELDFQGEAGLVARAEEPLLYTLFANLVKNAIEASPSGGRITIRVQGRDAAVVFIHNPGAIPQSIRPRFFQKFVTASKQGGTGLGAYSAKLIAETLGGRIGAQSTEESGTTITVELPPA